MYQGFSRNKCMGGGGWKALLFFTHHASNFQNHNPTLHKNINYYYTHHASNSIDNQKCEKHFG